MIRLTVLRLFRLLVIFFAGWLLMMWLLNRKSLAQDAQSGSDQGCGKVAAPGLIFWAFSVTFLAVDWILSVNPKWFSTIFGLPLCIVAFEMMLGRPHLRLPRFLARRTYTRGRVAAFVARLVPEQVRCLLEKVALMSRRRKPHVPIGRRRRCRSLRLHGGSSGRGLRGSRCKAV